MTQDPHEWTLKAHCRDAGDALYPDTAAEAVKIIAQYCRPCATQEACLRDCLDYEQAHPTERRQGIRGGLTPRQRTALMKGARRK